MLYLSGRIRENRDWASLNDARFTIIPRAYQTRSLPSTSRCQRMFESVVCDYREQWSNPVLNRATPARRLGSIAPGAAGYDHRDTAVFFASSGRSRKRMIHIFSLKLAYELSGPTTRLVGSYHYGSTIASDHVDSCRDPRRCLYSVQRYPSSSVLTAHYKISWRSSQAFCKIGKIVVGHQAFRSCDGRLEGRTSLIILLRLRSSIHGAVTGARPTSADTTVPYR